MTYCTLFDKNYLSRGIALYRSLLKTHYNFSIYILAMDDLTEILLKKQNYLNTEVINLNAIINKYPELNKIRAERTKAEFCWTLTPFIISYCIEIFKLNSCTYLDSDLYFFSNPLPVLEKIQNNSILITEHNYTPEYDQSRTSGKYCVQFMFFKNDANGLIALNWWREKCTEWCYNRVEDNKFGDQKYLDDWITRFEDVFVPNHIGFGLAPWNIQKFNVTDSGNSLEVTDNITKEKKMLIFYHFHSLKEYNNKSWYLSGYTMPLNAIKLIYKPYIFELQKIQKELHLEKNVQIMYDNINITIMDVISKIICNLLSSIKNLFNGLNYQKVKKELVQKNKFKLEQFIILKSEEE